MIAGGGTGGHLFPGVAIVEELLSREPEAEVLFVGTARGIEARVVPELGHELALIDASGLKTVGARGMLRGLTRIPRAMLQSRRIVRQFRPDAVIGVGGYASGPAVLAARLAGVPTAILEQNSVPGFTNKILGKFVRAIFLAFDYTRQYFEDEKVEMTGNPIRADIVRAIESATDDRPEGAPPRIFVFGGSQGAMAVNELVFTAAGLLADQGLRPEILHQTGRRDLERTREAYRAAGIEADCRAFIREMAAEYQRSDLIVARAGATTVAELACVGKPAILIPYPFAADNHQEINARELADAGAALMFRQDDLTAEILADAVAGLLRDPGRRAQMGSAMKAIGRPDAASRVVDWCESQCSRTRT